MLISISLVLIVSYIVALTGDRPTVVEMLHHPWITMFQRRASVVMPSPALSAQYSGPLNATQDFPGRLSIALAKV
jgi:hypothetical protein